MQVIRVNLKGRMPPRQFNQRRLLEPARNIFLCGRALSYPAIRTFVGEAWQLLRWLTSRRLNPEFVRYKSHSKQHSSGIRYLQ